MDTGGISFSARPEESCNDCVLFWQRRKLSGKIFRYFRRAPWQLKIEFNKYAVFGQIFGKQEKLTGGTSLSISLTRFDDIIPIESVLNSSEGVSDGRVRGLSTTSLGS